MKEITRTQVVEMARSWIGVPYRHQGRSRLGVDCVGPLVAISKEIELEGLVDALVYSRFPESFSLKAQLDRLMVRIPKKEIRPGDVLLFKIDVLPQHVAIATGYAHGGLGMMHCYQRVGRVVEHRLAQVWLARLVQAYQIPGIIEG